MMALPGLVVGGELDGTEPALLALSPHGNLAVLDASRRLQVFDTADLSDIHPKGSADYPEGLWGAVGVPNSAGGEVYVSALECPDNLPTTSCPAWCRSRASRLGRGASSRPRRTSS